MLDLVIIGAGPAGLTAAIYAARAQMNAVIIENHIAGGQIATTGAVDNYPGMPGVQGLVMAEQFRTHAEQMGAHFQRGQVTGIENSGTGKKILLADGEPLTTQAVIAATGAAPRPLGVPGEEALRGNGVSYCAMCDGAFFYGKRVCVVGGGDTAVEDAFSLSRQASEVILIHRRDSLRAQKAHAARVLGIPNVSARWNAVVTEILSEGGRVSGVRVQDVKNHKEEILPVDGVFIAVGMAPETGFLRPLGIVDEYGYVQAGEDCRTAVPGLFAAGDLRRKAVRQIVTAAADGASAIRSVQAYLELLEI